MTALMAAFAMTLLPAQQDETDRSVAARKWIEVYRLDYDASVVGRRCASDSLVGPLTIDHLDGGRVGVFVARLVPRVDDLKDLRVIFVDQDGDQFEGFLAMQSSREEDRGTLAAVMYTSPDDCPADSIRTIVFEHADTETLKAILEKQDKARKALETKVAEVIGDCPLPKPVVGQPYPFAVTCIDGSKVSTKDWQGKVIVIDFWATWCAPCLMEMPELKKLYERYHSQGLEILGVSLDRDRKELEGYVRKEAIAWPQFFVGDNVRRAALMQVTGASSIPRYFVLDRTGRLHADDGRGKLEILVPTLLAGSD
jgi:thiol-disulfide isomerase/thioredoxin